MKELREAFGVEGCKSTNAKIVAHEDSESMDASLYHKLEGSLIWILNSRVYSTAVD